MRKCNYCDSASRALHKAGFVDIKPDGTPVQHTGQFCSQRCYNAWCEELELRNDEVHRRAARVAAKAEAFPEHTHVWEMQLIDNVPVGASCKICTDSVAMSSGEAEPRKSSQLLALRYGEMVDIDMGRGVMSMVVDTMTMSSDYSSGTTVLDVTFRSRAAMMKRSASSYKSDEKEVWDNYMSDDDPWDRQDEKVFR